MKQFFQNINPHSPIFTDNNANKLGIFLILFLLLTNVNVIAQDALYQKIDKTGNYDTYTTSYGATISQGDTLTIGLPRGDTFTFITQGNTPVSSFMAGTTPVVTKLKSVGNKRQGYRMYAIFKGYGLVPVYVDIENAYKTGEID